MAGADAAGDVARRGGVCLIGVGGSSCSGKTTLALWLSEILRCQIVHQDQFYKKDSEVPVRDGIQDWDCPDALNMSDFAATLSRIKSDGPPDHSILGDNLSAINSTDLPPELIESIRRRLATVAGPRTSLVIVDGFLLYDDPRVFSVLDVRIFLHATFDTLLARRNSRKAYVTLEGTWTDPPNYFADLVYPAYVKYNARVLSQLTCPPTSVTRSGDTSSQGGTGGPTVSDGEASVEVMLEEDDGFGGAPTIRDNPADLQRDGGPSRRPCRVLTLNSDILGISDVVKTATDFILTQLTGNHY